MNQHQLLVIEIPNKLKSLKTYFVVDFKVPM